MLVNLYPTWEEILEDLSTLFVFEFKLVDRTINKLGKLQNSYSISEVCYAQKSDLDNYIKNGTVGSSEYARASVLYSLYACRYLTVTDLEYPTYQDWKNKYGLSIDHALPRYWFPRLTFDCTNWKPMSFEDNQNKGDDFLNEGTERLQWLSTNIKKIKSKYIS